MWCWFFVKGKKIQGNNDNLFVEKKGRKKKRFFKLPNKEGMGNFSPFEYAFVWVACATLSAGEPVKVTG